MSKPAPPKGTQKAGSAPLSSLVAEFVMAWSAPISGETARSDGFSITFGHLCEKSFTDREEKWRVRWRSTTRKINI
ncbi:MAG: hypothetical protein M3Q71_22280 [Chloroflexota bacterium]|nr:hypothetical protein [Chloroflexota bacterium]